MTTVQRHGGGHGKAGGGLVGAYMIRPIRPAFQEATRLFPRPGNYFELKHQALKLRHWPGTPASVPSGQVLDLDWDWIKAMPSQRVGELRVDDEIAGHDNLRLIFYVGEKGVATPLPIIWILAVLQKKRQDFTKFNIQTFEGRRILVDERFYKNREFL
jgi:hypothetical protein